MEEFDHFNFNTLFEEFVSLYLKEFREKRAKEIADKVKPLQHIIYSTAEQLKKDLIHKIEAWIK
jgi:hypothetical protein